MRYHLFSAQAVAGHGQTELHSALFFECRALSKIAQELSSSHEAAQVSELTAQITNTFEALCTVLVSHH